MMHHKEIEVNGRRIAYRESSGTGWPVLFIHGNSMSARSFERQFESSLGEHYRLVALDLPGHGESGPAPDPKSAYTLPGYATVVSGFARTLDICDAVLVGWSLGGHVLLEASEQLPELAGVMIFGTPPAGNPLAGDAFIPNPLIALMFKSNMNDEEAAAATAGFFRPGSLVPPFFIGDMKRTDGKAREALGVSVAEGHYADEVTVVARFNKPLAIVHGEMEPVASLPYLKGLDIPTLWRNEIQIIPDAAHAPQWEQPELFNRLLREFICDCTRRDSAA